MFYVDTSVLVAALTNEVHSRQAQDWLARQDPAELLISDWVITEFSSALSLKLRTGSIGLDHRRQALGLFRTLLTDTLTTIEVLPSHFVMAARLADQHKLGLRAGDALHLAVAAERAATLSTLDERLGEACAALGIGTHRP
jgi:predicted nucleic acid-binding protein